MDLIDTTYIGGSERTDLSSTHHADKQEQVACEKSEAHSDDNGTKFLIYIGLFILAVWVVDACSDRKREIEKKAEKRWREIQLQQRRNANSAGYQAGFNWALDNEITEKYDCDGQSLEFDRGCEAAVDAALESRIEAQYCSSGYCD